MPAKKCLLSGIFAALCYILAVSPLISESPRTKLLPKLMLLNIGELSDNPTWEFDREVENALYYVGKNGLYPTLAPLAAYFVRFSEASRSKFLHLLLDAQNASALDTHFPDWPRFVAEIPAAKINDHQIEIILKLINANPNKQTTPFVMQVLDHPKTGIRELSYRAGKRLEDDRLLPKLISFLEHPKAIYRLYGLQAFQVWQDERIKTIATESLQDSSKSVRMEALKSTQTWSSAQRYLLSRKYREDGHYGFRYGVVENINANSLAGQGYLTAEAVSDKHPRVRRKALETIRKLKYKNGGYSVIKQLGKETIPALQIEQLRLCREFEIRGGGTELARILLESPSIEARLLAAEYLGWLRDRNTKSALETALADNSADVVAASAKAIGELKTSESWTKLHRLIVQHESDKVKEEALLALAKLNNPDSIVTLYDTASRHPDAKWRSRVRGLVRELLANRFYAPVDTSRTAEAEDKAPPTSAQ